MKHKLNFLKSLKRKDDKTLKHLDKKNDTHHS